MTLVLQDDNGTAQGANAYVSTDYVRSYHTDRGVDLSGTDNTKLEAAIIKATQYIDARYAFVGQRRQRGQTTEWPRFDAYDRDEWLILGIPISVQQSTAELARRALTQELFVDPVRDETGRAVQTKTSGLGPLRERIHYSSGAPYIFPEYPIVDRMLVVDGIVRPGLTAMRA